MISIVLPVYNGADLLPRVLSSIEAQSYPPREVIIVNDASTDSTDEIINQFKLRNSIVRIINHQKNQGSTSAANSGFKEAKSKYVMKIDHDDYLENHCLFLLNNAVKVNPNKVFYYGDYYEIEDNKLFYKKMLHPFDTAANSILYNTIKLKNVGYYSTDILFAEYQLLLKLGLENGFYIDKPLYTYCRREGSLTKSEWYEQALNQFKKIYGELLAKRIRPY